MTDFYFYAITDRHKCTEPLVAHIARACSAGLRAVQLREKDLETYDLYRLARELRMVTGRYGAQLFINDRADVAMAVGADGVHCRETSLQPRAIKAMDERLTVGVSTHSVGQATRAEAEAADFVVFGPVFRTPSKPDVVDPKGLQKLSQCCEKVNIPVYALGGIGPDRVDECIEAGADGVAGISTWMTADDAREPIKQMKQVLSDL